MRGVGLFVGVELHANPVSALAGFAEAKRVVNGMCRRGVLIGSTGRHGNVLKIHSPLTFEMQHADVLIEALEQTLTEKDWPSFNGLARRMPPVGACERRATPQHQLC